MFRTSLLLFLPLFMQQPPTPYYDFSKAGAGFYGAGRELPDPEGLKSVRIGVLGPEKDPDGLQLRMAVDLALEEANRSGGYRRRLPYEAVFRPDDGPWGAVAGRVVELAYDDQVWAIIGGLDGQRTHIAELVVAKAWVPVVSPTAADSSVDYANVPWVFRCFPSDIKQAEALLGYARRRGLTRPLVLSEIQREAHAGFLRFKERAERFGVHLAALFEYPGSDPESVLPRLSGIEFDSVVLLGHSRSAMALALAVRRKGVTAPILGFAGLAVSDVLSSSDSLGDFVVAAPFDLDSAAEERAEFGRKFKERTGCSPSCVAYYAYDTARLLIRTVEAEGLNRVRIRDGLTRASFAGVTGRIQFDSLRANTSHPVLLAPREGRWHPLGSERKP